MQMLNNNLVEWSTLPYLFTHARIHHLMKSLNTVHEGTFFCFQNTRNKQLYAYNPVIERQYKKQTTNSLQVDYIRVYGQKKSLERLFFTTNIP